MHFQGGVGLVLVAGSRAGRSDGLRLGGAGAKDQPAPRSDSGEARGSPRRLQSCHRLLRRAQSRGGLLAEFARRLKATADELLGIELVMDQTEPHRSARPRALAPAARRASDVRHDHAG